MSIYKPCVNLKNLIKSIKIAFFILILCGCNKITVDVIADGTPLKPFIKISEEVQIDSLEIFEKENELWNYSDPVWSFYAQVPRTFDTFSVIEYGKVPDGFIEGNNSKVLEAGKVYRVFLRSGDKGFSVNFRVVKSDGKYFVEKVLNP